MLKMLIYIDKLSNAGGIERVVSNLVNMWVERYDVTILTKSNDRAFYNIDHRVKCKTLGIPYYLNMKSRISRIFCIVEAFTRSIGRLRRVFLKESYDVIYVGTPLNALEMYIQGKSTFRKTVIAEHASINAFNSIYTTIKHYLYPRAVAISVPNKSDTAEYQRLGYRARYIPHPLTFGPREPSNLNSKICLTVGRLTSDKQQILLLDVWRELNKYPSMEGWQLKIVGSGELKDQIIRYIEDHKIRGVELVGQTHEVDLYYRNASLFLLTSKMEGFGMVLLEAMSFGVPCISFDCPSGPRDVINNGGNGFLVDCYDMYEFSKKIRLYAEMSENEKISMGKAATKTIEGWKLINILDLWENLFHSIVSTNKEVL